MGTVGSAAGYELSSCDAAVMLCPLPALFEGRMVPILSLHFRYDLDISALNATDTDINLIPISI